MHTLIHRVNDFEVTGDGAAPAWSNTDWLTMPRVHGESQYSTRTKLLYSNKGLYCLVDCEDRRLTCEVRQDNDDIYKDDVVEMFLWPDERQDLYFEYELSPLNIELPILVPNHHGTFHGWLPWHYTGARRVRHAARVRGGAQEPGANVTGWSAEFFIPFVLLSGLGNTPPKPGTTWRANIYRIDYDNPASTSHWAWCTKTAQHFHRFKDFGVLEFGDAKA